MPQPDPQKPDQSCNGSTGHTGPLVVLSASQMMLMFVACALLGLIGTLVNPAIAYVFVALAAAIATFGFLGGVANVSNQFGTFGGAVGVFIAVLLLLFNVSPHAAKSPQRPVDLPVSLHVDFDGRTAKRDAIIKIQLELSRISTLINRYLQGEQVDGLIVKNDIPPLTAVFEELQAKKGLIGEEAYQALGAEGRTLIALVNDRGDSAAAAETWSTWQSQTEAVNAIVARLSE